MNAGVTWLRRALKRPSKSVKYLEAVSSTTFNLASPLSESALVEYRVWEAEFIHKPFVGCVNYPAYLFIMLLGHLVRFDEGLDVAEKCGHSIPRRLANGF